MERCSSMNIAITDPQSNNTHTIAWNSDKPPTDSDIHEILGQIQATEPKPLSANDIQGAGANFVQGATMGTGGTISGIANILATPAYKLAGLKMPNQSVGEQFASGREAFEKPEKEFAAATLQKDAI